MQKIEQQADKLWQNFSPDVEEEFWVKYAT